MTTHDGRGASREAPRAFPAAEAARRPGNRRGHDRLEAGLTPVVRPALHGETWPSATDPRGPIAQLVRARP